MKFASVVAKPNDILKLGHDIAEKANATGWSRKEASRVALFIAGAAKDTILAAFQNATQNALLVSVDICERSAQIELIHEGNATDVVAQRSDLPQGAVMSREKLHGQHTQVLRINCPRSDTLDLVA